MSVLIFTSKGQITGNAMKTNTSLMLKALSINLSLYSLIYALAYSLLNLTNFVASENLSTNSLFVLVCCVAGRDSIAFLKTNLSYIITFASIALAAYFFSDFMPKSVNTLSFFAMAMSPMIVVSLIVRSFDAQKLTTEV